tara:strand:- start:1019 stop:1384 length:366 start_codon:yes stop_codon:yes gene_type:complete
MSELSESNYKRISIINWILSIPLLVLFAWPYYYAAKLLGIDETMRYIGAFIFTIPFVLTILHGHVTMALGSAHRYLYYQWLEIHPFTFGVFFHPITVKTRFRLIFLIVSLLFLPVGYLLGV